MASDDEHNFQCNSVLSRLASDFKAAVMKKLQPRENIRAKVAENNSKQVERLATPNTIWHAVSRFKTPEGQESWISIKDNPDVLKNDDKGVFGETPLHIALLFNDPSEAFNAFFLELWLKSPPELRTTVYTEEPYKGENVLHIAIIKKVGLDLIKEIVKLEPTLACGKATGCFFKDRELSDNSCNNLGEEPLFFAACTNQMDVVKFLVNEYANHVKLDAVTTEGNNLLHLMVLNAFDDSSMPYKETYGVKTGGGRADIFREMFENILDLAKEKGLDKQMLLHKNKAQQTPLALAAAHGSVDFFNYLSEKTMVTAWNFGPVTCKKFLLEGIDDALNLNRAAPANEARAPSVLETLVKYSRKDIVSSSMVEKLVQLKWDRYGNEYFWRKLIKAILYVIIIFVMPILDAGEDVSYLAMISFLRVAASLFYLQEYFKVCKTSISKTLELVGTVCSFFLKRVLFDDFLCGLFKDYIVGHTVDGVDTRSGLLAAQRAIIIRRKELFEEVQHFIAGVRSMDISWVWIFSATVPPCVSLLCARFILTSWVKVLLGVDLLGHVLAAMWNPAVHLGYLFVSVMAFGNVLYLVTCFERIGSFVMMLRSITFVDLPVFAAIYVIFLFGSASLYICTHIRLQIPKSGLGLLHYIQIPKSGLG